MNAATLSLVDNLVAGLSGLSGLPAGIAAMVALLAKVRQERRDVRPDELAALRSDDDALSAELDSEINAARSNP